MVRAWITPITWQVAFVEWQRDWTRTDAIKPEDQLAALGHAGVTGMVTAWESSSSTLIVRAAGAAFSACGYRCSTATCRGARNDSRPSMGESAAPAAGCIRGSRRAAARRATAASVRARDAPGQRWRPTPKAR